MKSKKIVNICLIITAFFLYLVAAQIVELVFDWLNIPIKSLISDYGVTIVDLIAAGVAVVVYIIVLRIQSVNQFLNEAVIELSKVSFPTRKESSQSAAIVVLMVAVATACLKVFDIAWQYVTKYILAT